MIICKTAGEIEKLRQSGQTTREILEELRPRVQPGVTTWELEEFVAKRLKQLNVKPAFKGYHGYPACLCASVNEEIIHGIPSGKRLKAGDIISLDMGVVKDGYFGDCAITVPVGEINEFLQRLLRVSEESLEMAIDRARPGFRIGDISAVIQQHAEENGYSVVREFTGHGIGRSLHEEPQVPNFGEAGQGPPLKEGMVLALETMINSAGSAVRILKDNWTAVTADGGHSAHFEHMVAITKNGPDVLTRI
ncbi:MAG TPA: type I methionyl aminopeptidase [Terriglobia bacterium]|nr:type I methionyl aminopeptidase [Terriglobia bacterium]